MGGETTRVENRGETTRGETTRGETSWGRNVLLPLSFTRAQPQGKVENSYVMHMFERNWLFIIFFERHL